MEQQIKKVILAMAVILFCASLLLNGWLAYQLSAVLTAYNSQQIDSRVLAFANMFVEDVLMANKEIDFDTRLFLETAVRGLNDQEIFNQWQKFTKAETKENSSTEAKYLLDLLIKKIKVAK